MSSNLFTPSLRYTNKDTCNSAWTFIDGQNVSDIEVPKFIKNLFTSFDDSRYGKMGKDLIEGAAGDPGESCIENPGGEPTCNGNLSCINSVCINNVCEQSVCSGNNVLIDPLPTLGTGVSPTDQNCCVSPTTRHTCSSAFQGATDGKDQPCNLNYPASKGWTKGNFEDDPLWAKYDNSNDDSSLTKDQSDAVKYLISTNSGKDHTYTPDQMDDEVWKRCCKKAECTDEGWGDISITDATGSWTAWALSLGC